jgi:beta-phosphoglucomutase-like phosphatase (HAD superfamily)
MKTHTLKAAAVDIDGVLVADTFSPVIKLLVEEFGGVYDREIERHVFSQNRSDAARYLLDRLGLDLSIEDFVALYFRTRDQWIDAHGGGLNADAGRFLDVLEDSGLRLVCYGGLPRSHFEKELGPWASRFETYVCTNDFRPGVQEIVRDVFALPPREVLFFDDVSRVAEAARLLGCPFVGVPAAWPWGYQKSDMLAVGVPVLLQTLSDLTVDRMTDLDKRALRGYWG